MNQHKNVPDTRHAAPEVITPLEFRPVGAALKLPRPNLPWARGLLPLVILAGMWGAWYVVTSRSVEVATTPTDAAVSFDELFSPSIGDHWLLRPGERHLIVEAPGYRPFNDNVRITDEQLQTHTVELRPLPGDLRINVTPVASAKVTIDNLIEATVPSTVKNIDAGPRQIRVSAKRYLPFSTVIEMEGRGIEQHLEVTLHPAWAEVSFRSKPNGALVAIDQRAIGETPLEAELLRGNRTVSISLDGYKPWQRTLAVSAGTAIDLPPIVLEKADGHLTVTSTPIGASILLGAKFKGKSPVTFSVLSDEKFTLTARKEGYNNTLQSIEVSSGETKRVNLVLAPELAAVQIIATPADAELIIDGVPRGVANQTLKLPTHAHTIEVRKAGYVAYSASVTLRKGIKKRIKVRLKTPIEAAASAERAKSSTRSNSGVISTFVKQQLKLFRGGDVTMGSSRRDPNRRANEVLRDVKLVRPFYFGIHEVTNGEFRQYLGNHHAASIKGVDIDGDNHPVVKVSWESAALFCNWLSRKDSLGVFYEVKNGQVLGINPAAVGYRLPTEAEWSWVARSEPKSSALFEFPWAGKFPPHGRSGNYADQSASGLLGRVINDYNDGVAVTAPVGSFPASLRGIHDLGGNVSEWTNDFYSAAEAGTGTRAEDPLGARSGAARVIRGSNWAQSSATELRLAYRDFGINGRDEVGFRIARYAE